MTTGQRQRQSHTPASGTALGHSHRLIQYMYRILYCYHACCHGSPHAYIAICNRYMCSMYCTCRTYIHMYMYIADRHTEHTTIQGQGYTVVMVTSKLYTCIPYIHDRHAHMYMQLENRHFSRGTYMYTHVHIQVQWWKPSKPLYTYTHDESRTCICKLKQGKASKAKSEGRQ